MGTGKVCMSLWQKFRGENPPSAVASIPAVSASLDNLDLDNIPIHPPTSVLKLLGYSADFDGLYRLVGLSETHFDLLYRQPLLRLASMCQLAPASEANHHCGPGGLLTHTLEVIDIALRIRRSYQLPIGGTPTQLTSQEHHWTYGVFVATLMHDVGKLLSRIQLVLAFADGRSQLWTPHDKPIHETGACSYRVRFVQAPYKAHQRLALTLYADLLPQQARAWLGQHTQVMAQCVATIWGDEYESQVIGEIVSRADRESSAKNDDVRHRERRFPGAADSIADRLISKLRQLLSESALRINQDGSIGWVAGEHCYFVCKPLADQLINAFAQAGETNIPADPLRIFDVLQDHGFALPTPDGKAIHRVEVADGKGRFKHTFTCLKLETRRLWSPVKLPQNFFGVIRNLEEGHQETGAVVEAASATAAARMIEPANTPRVPKEIASVHSEPVEASTNQREPVEAVYAGRGGVLPTRNHLPDDQPILLGQAAPARACESVEPVNKSREAAENVQPRREHVETVRQSRETGAAHLRVHADAWAGGRLTWDDDVGTAFWEWLRAGIAAKSLEVNHREAGVHFVTEGVFLVSPRIFQIFCRAAGLEDTGYTRVQKRFQRLKINLKTRLTQMNVHTYIVDNGTKQGRLSGWLIEYSRFFLEGQELPAVNEYLRTEDFGSATNAK